MNLSFRLPHAADFPALSSWLPDAAACLRWAGPRVVFPFSPPELQAMLAVEGGQDRALADEAALLGFGQFWVNVPGAVHLGRIIVTPDRRGEGLGRALCERLMDEAVRVTGQPRVTLRVYADNAPARALYSTLGFETVASESTPEVLFMAAQPGLKAPRLR